MYPNLKKYIQNYERNFQIKGIVAGFLLISIGGLATGGLLGVINTSYIIFNTPSRYCGIIIFLFSSIVMIIIGIVTLYYYLFKKNKIEDENVKDYFNKGIIDELENEMGSLKLIAKEVAVFSINKYYATNSFFINGFEVLKYSSIISISSKRIPFFQIGKYGPYYRTKIEYKEDGEKAEDYKIEFYRKRNQKKVVEYLKKMNPACKLHL